MRLEHENACQPAHPIDVIQPCCRALGRGHGAVANEVYGRKIATSWLLAGLSRKLPVFVPSWDSCYLCPEGTFFDFSEMPV